MVSCGFQIYSALKIRSLLKTHLQYFIFNINITPKKNKTKWVRYHWKVSGGELEVTQELQVSFLVSFMPIL